VRVKRELDGDGVRVVREGKQQQRRQRHHRQNGKQRQKDQAVGDRTGSGCDAGDESKGRADGAKYGQGAQGATGWAWAGLGWDGMGWDGMDWDRDLAMGGTRYCGGIATV
jgi:hypothetical protein